MRLQARPSAHATGAAAAKLAVFAVVTLAALALLAMAIRNSAFTATTSYQALFTDATGVSRGDEVRLAGVRVGSVDGVELDGDRLARVTFSVDRSVPLTTATWAKLRYRDLIGQRYLALVPERIGAPALPAEAVIGVERTRPALDLTVLFNGFRPLFAALTPDQVNRLSYELIRVFQGEGGTIRALLTHLASVTGTLADRDALIGSLIDNLNQVLATFDQRAPRLAELVTNLQSLVSGLSQDRRAIGSALAGFDRLTGSLDGLLTQARPSLSADITHLAALTGTLDQGDNKAIVDDLLRRMPGKFQTLSSIVSRGGWAEAYLCGFDIRYGTGTGQRTPAVVSRHPRCSR